MNAFMIIGIAVTLAAILSLTVWTGFHNRDSALRKNGRAIVTGIVVGTLIGGSSTVGTAQLAFTYGMSAWWFTLGGGIACLILALVYEKPLRRAECATLVGIIHAEYGDTAGMLASVLSAVGTFINIIAQLISATAVISVVTPRVGIVPAVLFSALFMTLYVVFGGVRSAGVAGIAKAVLIYVAMIGCGVIVLHRIGGVPGFVDMVHGIDNPEGVRFLSLFARGAGKDIGAGLSTILGVLTTQTYAQGVLSAKTEPIGRQSALLSAFLIPPVGVGGILVGLYMRANAGLYPGLTAKTALTTFITAHFPPLLAGIILATLFIAVIGTGSGLTLGIATILNNDVVKNLTRRYDDPRKETRLSRLWIVLILAAASTLSTGRLGDVIIHFSFMSMGLRGAVVFVPLSCALWLPGRIDRRYAIASIVISPLVVLVFGILNILPIDALFIGIFASFIIMGMGFRRPMHP